MSLILLVIVFMGIVVGASWFQRSTALTPLLMLWAIGFLALSQLFLSLGGEPIIDEMNLLSVGLLAGYVAAWIKTRPWAGLSLAKILCAAFLAFVAFVKVVEFYEGYHLWYKNFGPFGLILLLPGVLAMGLNDNRTPETASNTDTNPAPW